MNLIDLMCAISKRIFRFVSVRDSVLKKMPAAKISNPSSWSKNVPLRYLAKSYLSNENPYLEGVDYDGFGVAIGFKHWQLRDNPLPPCSSSLHLLNLNEAISVQNNDLFIRNATYLESLIDDSYQLRYADIFLEDEHLKKMPSCLSNGLACSVFVRAHKLTGDFVFKEALRKLVEGLQITTENGGAMEKRAFGPVLLEYPGSRKKSLVLNGWIAALIGLLESRVILDGSDEFISASVSSFLYELPKFEFALGHRYSRDWSRLSGGVYPVLLCFQLLHLGELLQSKYVVDLSENWTKYVRWKFKESELNIVGSKERYFKLLNEVRLSMT